MTDRRFLVSDTPLDGLKLVGRRRIEDSRGFLSRFFCADELAGAGFADPVMQINQTLTRKAGVIRGMHYQLAPHMEDKLVSCLKGAVFDIAVDLRAGSPTFLKWHGETLSAENQRSLLIPKGFAHGFQTLTEDCELLYLHSASYRPDGEAALNAFDPVVAIAWPLPMTEMSPRDRAHPFLPNDFAGLNQ